MKVCTMGYRPGCSSVGMEAYHGNRYGICCTMSILQCLPNNVYCTIVNLSCSVCPTMCTVQLSIYPAVSAQQSTVQLSVVHCFLYMYYHTVSTVQMLTVIILISKVWFITISISSCTLFPCVIMSPTVHFETGLQIKNSI